MDRDDDYQTERSARRKPEAKPEQLKHTPEVHRNRTLTRADLHEAAAILHGWALHAHHEGAPIQITAEAYAAAIEAVDARPLKPHPGALSPHAGRRL